MQRKIKFRVYDYDMEKMRYLNGDHDFICFDEKGNGYYHNMQTGLGEWFSELMQYTGLKDKNNTPIYEGDIVKSPYTNDDNLYIIAYWKFGFMLQGQKDGNYYDFIGDLLGRLEVIGNIYDNKEDI